MKKFLALLLTMLLPVCAMAETNEFGLYVDTDEVYFPMLAKQLLPDGLNMPADVSDLFVSMVQKIVNGLRVFVSVQEDAIDLEVQLAGQSLVDLTTYECQDATYCTSSLIPGYALVEKKTAELPAADAVNQIDWKKAADSAARAADLWFANMEPMKETGLYVDDAYVVKGECTAWTLGDKDIAALLSALATEEVRQAVSLSLSAMGLEADAVWNWFDARTASVADEDRYLYALYILKDEAGAIGGISLDVYGETATEMLATVSLGLVDGINLVVGLGLEEENYWWQLYADVQEQSDILVVSGVSREWSGIKGHDFAGIQENATPEFDAIWQFGVLENETSAIWEGRICRNDEEQETLLSTEGIRTKETSAWDAVICLGGRDKAGLTLSMNYGPTGPIPPMDSGLELCASTDQQYSELMDQMTSAVAARMIKLLPMDLILKLNQRLQTP